jgi:hypothetical protein
MNIDGKSRNSLDWPLKSQCQTAKSLQFLRELEKRLTGFHRTESTD